MLSSLIHLHLLAVCILHTCIIIMDFLKRVSLLFSATIIVSLSETEANGISTALQLTSLIIIILGMKMLYFYLSLKIDRLLFPLWNV
jgi:hypothetical protein